MEIQVLVKKGKREVYKMEQTKRKCKTPKNIFKYLYMSINYIKLFLICMICTSFDNPSFYCGGREVLLKVEDDHESFTINNQRAKDS